MSAQPTTWTTFGPDLPPSALPLDLQACLPPNQPTEACDALVGSAALGYGYCAEPAYQRMTYCACVNNAVGCPEYAMASCANSAFSYRPWAWYQPGPAGQPSRDQMCEKAPICVDLVEVGGSQNVVSDITQQCGAVTNLSKRLGGNPALVVLALVLLITLVAVLSARVDADDAPAAPARRRKHN